MKTTRARSGRSPLSRGRVRAARCLAPLLLALALSACGGGGVAVSDTYCRDTFHWRTGARDSAETRKQADLHNSRRLCKCADDCPPTP
jgi:hypothetical protein